MRWPSSCTAARKQDRIDTFCWSALTGAAGKGVVPADAHSSLQSAGLLTECKIVVGAGMAVLFGCPDQDGVKPVQ